DNDEIIHSVPSGFGEEYDDLLGNRFSGVTLLTAGCVDKDTEYMTPTGWKKISDYTYGDDVLQWEPDGSTEFVKPLDYIKKPVDTFYHLNTPQGVDQMLSPEHIVPYMMEGNLLEKPMEELYQQHIKTKQGFGGTFITTFDAPKRSGIDMTDSEIRLYIAISADGSIESSNTIRVNLKKDVKKVRFKRLLEEAGVQYKEKLQTNGYTVFRFTPKYIDKDLSRLWGCSPSQLNVIYDEFVYWDGSVDSRNGNKEFSTTIKAHADFMQYVINCCGNTNCSLKVKDRVGQTYTTGGKEYIRKSIEYKVLETSTKGTGLKSTSRPPTDTIRKLDMPEGTLKYCFTMPSGYFIIRRNGRVVVTHNSGGGKSVQLLASAIEAFKEDQAVLFVSLELSAKALGARLKAYVCEIDFNLIIKDTLTVEQKAHVEKTMKEFWGDREEDFKIVTEQVDDKELLAMISVQAQTSNVTGVYIDYLGLIGSSSAGESWKSLSNLVKALHKMTISHGIVVVTAAQIAEVKIENEQHVTLVSRGSAELVFSASVVLYTKKMDDTDEEAYVIYSVKNRYAKLVHSIVEGQLHWMRFKDSGIRLNP
ncbi:MAG: DnaB-like helicase C-terminal domain-containing protein, partial [Thermodesulfobacteriota bacterium]|nr:DnaB-like helicase C-terminal domain-containing protein [Thermodesulfobacteriota bacterium]